MALPGQGWTPRILLVMRRSGVRFPKAAQFGGLISLLCSIVVDRHGRYRAAIAHAEQLHDDYLAERRKEMGL